MTKTAKLFYKIAMLSNQRFSDLFLKKFLYRLLKVNVDIEFLSLKRYKLKISYGSKYHYQRRPSGVQNRID
jgi:hypothetical protein